MRLPSKIFSFEESAISKFPTFMAALQNNPLSPRELYVAMKNKTENIGEFLEILDYLYALGKIAYDNEEGKLTIC